MALKVVQGSLLAVSTTSIKHQTFNKSTAAVETIIPAVTGKTLRVLGLMLFTHGAVTVTWTSLGTGAVILPAASFVGNGGIVASAGGVPMFSAPAGEGIRLTLSAAIQVTGVLSYIEE